MKITIYSTTTCPYCVMLKSWLSSKSIEFTNYNVDQNPIAAQNMVNLSGQMGVPFSTIEFGDGRIEKILGFDRPKFEAALKS
jgi:glutaredoxin